MDHLYRLSDPFPHDDIEIPYVCQSDYVFTGEPGAWFSYPHRCGWQLYADTYHIRQNPESWASFIQTWLYFGILSEGIQASVKSKSFVRESDGHYFLCTDTLPHVLLTALQEAKRSETEMQIQRRTRDLDLILNRHANILTGLLEGSAGALTESAFLALTILSDNIMIFISSLMRCNILFEVDPKVKLSWGPSGRTRMYRHKQLQILKSRFLKAGWCPSEIEWATQYLLAPDQFVASGLRRLGQVNHTVCTSEACVVGQMDPRAYRTRHALADCCCRHVTEVRVASLQSIAGPTMSITEAARLVLQEGSLPVFSINDNDVTVFAAPLSSSDPPIKYVAISHVWRDGLGNTQANSLPLCQFIRLQSLVDDLYPDRSPDQHIAFWLDTLSVPLTPHADRKLAISRMRDTYQKADKVLVLDSELLSVSIVTLSLDVLLRIGVCGWTKRLWTYQEGILGRNLIYRFANLSISWWKLAEFSGEARPELALSGISTAGLSALVMYAGFGQIYDRGEIEKGLKLQVAAHALRQRTTTREEDEAVCLGTICDVDATAILDLQTAKQRMVKFYQCLDYIPWSILFCSGARINQRGFRWAPQSFLSRRIQNFRLPWSRGGISSPGGLVGMGSGVLFSDYGIARNMEHFCFKDVVGSQRWFFVEPADEDWKQCTATKTSKDLLEYGTCPKLPFDVTQPFTAALLLFEPLEQIQTVSIGVYVHIKSLSFGSVNNSSILVSYIKPVEITALDSGMRSPNYLRAVENPENNQLLLESGMARHGIYVTPTTRWCIE